MEESIRLLGEATSLLKAEEVYHAYINSSKDQLFLYIHNGMCVGCVGLKQYKEEIVLNHIAVDANFRSIGIGKSMVEWIGENFKASILIAETDREAVGFYKQLGFEITSLGEKYPGVERFRCHKKIEKHAG
ncbi:GNAT family N-acetyltransferase [Halobacillus salinus]|uniref:N-acetyltransferase n=1 Tax=Halobacillus salinus TaxID=192814 RepID=A0A4Z0H5B3_9BACI|nr:GNAT family N-acetyltransferase [Halobacillus salinus]TGB04631.1 N-acetyltransferase [Halobacillus salinus]